MAYQNDSGGNRQMFQGDWSCTKCGKSITELPFEPTEDRLSALKCRDCFMEDRPARSSGGRFGGGDRVMHKGNWSCGSCGNSITELPFKPDPARLSGIKCRDCYRTGRND